VERSGTSRRVGELRYQKRVCDVRSQTWRLVLSAVFALGVGYWSRAAYVPRQFTDAPAWMHYLGPGNETDPNVTTSATIQGLHYYANFTVASGGTLTVGSTNGSATPQDFPAFGLIVVSPGTCTVAGTIAANAIFNHTSNIGGDSGGGGGFGAANGVVGNTSIYYGIAAFSPIVIFGGAAGTSGVSGGTPGALLLQNEEFTASHAWAHGSCGGASGGAGGSTGGAGGNGGGCVELICDTINFTGTINVNGGNGGAGGASTGGGGGGGGGFVIEAAETYTANTGTINTAGGAGGAIGTGTSTAGGTGGAGWSAVYTLNN